MSNRTVYKYVLGPAELHSDQTLRAKLSLPRGARIVGWGVQGVDIVVWALVQLPVMPTDSHEFFLTQTGRTMPAAELEHVVTLQVGGEMPGTSHRIEPTVWHIWREPDF